MADSNASVPTTAVDASSGAVYFTWFGVGEENGPGVYIARLAAADSAVSAPVQVNPAEFTVNAHRQAPAQVAVAADGTVYVAWSTREVIEGRRFPASDLVVARSADAGSTFERPVFVNDDAGDAPAGHTFHDLVVGPDGTVYVSWLDSRGDGTDVRVATSRDGGRTFSPGVVVARGTCECCRTALAVDGTTVYVAWRHVYGDNIRDVAIARSDDAGLTFSEPFRVRNDGWKIDGCPHSGPSLSVDDEGSVHVVWYTAAENSVGVHYAVSSDRGATFSEEDLLERGVPNAVARLAGHDPLWVVWEDPLVDRLHAGSIREADRTMTFTGSSPEIGASPRVRSVVWQSRGAVEAHVERFPER